MYSYISYSLRKGMHTMKMKFKDLLSTYYRFVDNFMQTTLSSITLLKFKCEHHTLEKIKLRVVHETELVSRKAPKSFLIITTFCKY